MTRKLSLMCGIVSSRINIGVFLLWVVVLATILLSARDTAAAAGRESARAAWEVKYPSGSKALRTRSSP
jgi:hypothetical protein